MYVYIIFFKVLCPVKTYAEPPTAFRGGSDSYALRIWQKSSRQPMKRHTRTLSDRHTHSNIHE